MNGPSRGGGRGGWLPPDMAAPPPGAPTPAAPWQTGVTAHQGARQIPILCIRCRGPAAPGRDGSLVCPYCGHRDQLPADQFARAMELQRRLSAAAEGVAQMRGLESALGHVFESRGAFVRAAGLWLFLAAAVAAYALVSSWGIIGRAPPGFRAGLAVNALMGPSFVAGIGVAVCLALLVGRASYRRRVRVHLFARAAREPGHPTRCRACDGDLPDRRDAFVACEYCHTQNLVTPEIQRDRERLLAAEVAFYRARAQGAVAATTRGSLRMSRVFAVCVALTYAGMIGLAYLAQSLFPHAR